MKTVVHNNSWQNVFPNYPDKYFDIIIDDVNYGINAGKMNFVSRAKTYVIQGDGSKIFLPTKKYTVKDWDTAAPGQDYIEEVQRVSKHQIIFGVDYAKWTGIGPGRIKWDKCVPDGCGYGRYETAYCSFISDTFELKLLWSGMMQAKSLSEPTRQQANKKLNEKRIHPCHKPVLLYLALLQKAGIQPGMKIGDTHVGGGSSRIAAHKFRCEYVGSEKEKEYFDAHQLRFKHYLSKLELNFPQ